MLLFHVVSFSTLERIHQYQSIILYHLIISSSVSTSIVRIVIPLKSPLFLHFTRNILHFTILHYLTQDDPSISGCASIAAPKTCAAALVPDVRSNASAASKVSATPGRLGWAQRVKPRSMARKKTWRRFNLKILQKITQQPTKTSWVMRHHETSFETSWKHFWGRRKKDTNNVVSVFDEVVCKGSEYWCNHTIIH